MSYCHPPRLSHLSRPAATVPSLSVSFFFFSVYSSLECGADILPLPSATRDIPAAGRGPARRPSGRGEKTACCTARSGRRWWCFCAGARGQAGAGAGRGRGAAASAAGPGRPPAAARCAGPVTRPGRSCSAGRCTCCAHTGRWGPGGAAHGGARRGSGGWWPETTRNRRTKTPAMGNLDGEESGRTGESMNQRRIWETKSPARTRATTADDGGAEAEQNRVCAA